LNAARGCGILRRSAIRMARIAVIDDDTMRAVTPAAK
jgi:hypothetical protein